MAQLVIPVTYINYYVSWSDINNNRNIIFKECRVPVLVRLSLIRECHCIICYSASGTFQVSKLLLPNSGKFVVSVH